MTDASASPSNQTEASFSAVTTVGLAEEAAEILTETRSLNIEIVASLGWRSSKPGNDGSITIEIPYYEGKEEVNCKTRTISGEKRFFQRKGGKKLFYNHNVIHDWQQSENDALLICEGEIDCVTAMQCGYLAVSVPDGAPAAQVEDKEHSLKYTYLEGFPRKGVVIICADGDDAGANLLRDLVDQLGEGRCKWISYPKGCKDLNEVLVKYGERGVHETIKRAKWMQVDGVYRMSELPPLPTPEPVACQIFPINLRLGEMSVWTGHAGEGKSTLLNYLSSLFVNRGWPCAVASFEQAPQTEHKDALRTIFLRCRPRNTTNEEVDKADRWIDQNYVFIVPNDDMDIDVDLTWLLNKMAIAVMRHGAKIIIIDPWNELDHKFDRREMNLTDYTGFAVKQLKKFARRYRVHVAVVAHPAKMKRERGGKSPIPNLHDIADSAHWANKPDLGSVIYLKDGYTWVKVAKSRYQETDKIGPKGDYPLMYDAENKTFAAKPEDVATYSMASPDMFDKDLPPPTEEGDLPYGYPSQD